MANRIYIDGTEYTGEVIGIDDLQVTFALNDSTKTVNTAVSSSLTFIRSAFNYLENKFYSDESGRNAIALITIIVDCCDNKEITLALRGDATTICFQECKIETQAFDDSDEIKLSNLLRNTIIETELDIHPKIRTCADYGGIVGIMLDLMAFFTGFFTNLADIIEPLFPNAAERLEAFRNRLIGCDLFANTFFVKDILEFSLGKIGMTLQSSILQGGEYENVTWLEPDFKIIPSPCPQMTKLGPKDNVSLFTDNTNTTINGLLTILSAVFNADYRIKGTTLIFERVDFFVGAGGELVNVEEKYNDNLADCPVYAYASEPKFDNGFFHYEKDNIEESGNYAYNAYKDRVEWNIPFNPLQVGQKEVSVPLAPLLVVGDGFVSDYVSNNYQLGYLLIDNNALPNRTFPKLIVVSPQASNDPDWCNAQIVSVLNAENANYRDYNYPMYFNHDYPSTTGPSELYNNFWNICDPRNEESDFNVIQEISSFEFLFDCNEVNLIFENGIDLDIITRFGIGRADEIVIDFRKKTITVNNVKIYGS